MHCVARMIKLVLGPDAVAPDKCDFGRSLCVLGVRFEMDPQGFRCLPDCSKARRWCVLLEKARARLPPGDASKLAGKLSWACSALFRKLGRAMLRCDYILASFVFMFGMVVVVWQAFV